MDDKDAFIIELIKQKVTSSQNYSTIKRKF